MFAPERRKLVDLLTPRGIASNRSSMGPRCVALEPRHDRKGDVGLALAEIRSPRVPARRDAWRCTVLKVARLIDGSASIRRFLVVVNRKASAGIAEGVGTSVRGCARQD